MSKSSCCVAGRRVAENFPVHVAACRQSLRHKRALDCRTASPCPKCVFLDRPPAPRHSFPVDIWSSWVTQIGFHLKTNQLEGQKRNACRTVDEQIPEAQSCLLSTLKMSIRCDFDSDPFDHLQDMPCSEAELTVPSIRLEHPVSAPHLNVTTEKIEMPWKTLSCALCPSSCSGNL